MHSQQSFLYLYLFIYFFFQLATEVKTKMIEAEDNYATHEGVKKSWDAVQTNVMFLIIQMTRIY